MYFETLQDEIDYCLHEKNIKELKEFLEKHSQNWKVHQVELMVAYIQTLKSEIETLQE